jgi:hypothetical protein
MNSTLRERFEKWIGITYIILSLIVLPIPFIGFFSISQVITAIIVGYTLHLFFGLDIFNDPSLKYVFFLIPCVISLFFIAVNISIMNDFAKFRSSGMWMRLIGYILVALINVGIMYAYVNFQPR